MTETVRWQRLDGSGRDVCALLPAGAGWRLSGHARFVHEGAPCSLRYEVACDGGWRTTGATVAGLIGARAWRLEIARRDDGAWRLDGAEQAGVSGLLDLDLAFTPATNLLPIRRLGLSIGQAAEAPAAWLAFPEPRLARLAQRYERTGEDRYQYEAPELGYAAVLAVSPGGFVVDYPGLWRALREAARDGGA